MLRAAALPGEPERVAAGPGLLARRFGLTRSDDSRPVTGEHNVWLAPRPASFDSPELVTTTRIGISQGQDLPLRWYLRLSRSVSRRAKGDRTPSLSQAWFPSKCEVAADERLAPSPHSRSGGLLQGGLRRGCSSWRSGFVPCPSPVPANFPALQGRLVATLFFEPSTRTRSSFELAAKAPFSRCAELFALQQLSEQGGKRAGYRPHLCGHGRGCVGGPPSVHWGAPAIGGGSGVGWGAHGGAQRR